jgi:SNF2 family DNA or RNA helicase
MSYGANLQCATYVINYDLPWNPAKLDQRIARAYRIGQKETVTAINMVTENSIEDMILEKIGFKRQLFRKFFGKTSEGTKSLSLQDMLAILRGK